MAYLMDQDEAVRKSIARISFNWPTTTRNGKKKTKTVVICGVIVSIKDDGSCLVIADPTFFKQKNCPFVVNLPIAEGYDAVPVAPSAKFLAQCFCVLVLQLQANHYVRPVTIETRAVRTCDDVGAFVFPQEDFFTPTGYWPGYIVNGEDIHRGTLKIDIPFHSYAHFGSPVFNKRGHLVGICFSSTDAWPVSSIQEAVFREAKIRSVLGSVSYVLNGNPVLPGGHTEPEGSAPCI